MIGNANLWSQNYAYQEEFSGQGNWTRDNNIRELYVSNGKYYFEHKKTKGYREITSRTFNLDKTKDLNLKHLF